MPDQQWLATQFAEHESRLRAVALRLLGSGSDADDAVQEAWLRLSGADEIDNLGGWLTTVVSRIALDMLRRRSTRSERPLDVGLTDAETLIDLDALDPAELAVSADTVSAALLVVLDRLVPAERLAFVLHDLFGVSFAEIGQILGRSTAASKQLGHRARRKVRSGGQDAGDLDEARQRAVVEAFLDASRSGNLTALVQLLDPDVALTADTRAVAMGANARVDGADEVASVFSGRALGAEAATVDGGPGMIWRVDGKLRVAWLFVIEALGRVESIDMLADTDTLERLEVDVQ